MAAVVGRPKIQLPAWSKGVAMLANFIYHPDVRVRLARAKYGLTVAEPSYEDQIQNQAAYVPTKKAPFSKGDFVFLSKKEKGFSKESSIQVRSADIFVCT